MSRFRIGWCAGLAMHFLSMQATAQAPREAQRPLFVGLSAGGYIGNPYGELLGMGALAGIERDLGDALQIRGVASVLRGIRTGDDISICRIGPADGCLPDPYFPLWLWTLETNVSVAILPRVPIRLLGGVGFSIAADPREPARATPKPSLAPESQTIWRYGLDLGGSGNSPHLLFTRARFAPRPYNLDHIQTITFQFRP